MGPGRWRRGRQCAVVAIAGAWLASCGRPVISASAYDSPLFAIQARVVPPNVELPANLEAGVLWIDPLQQRARDIPGSPDGVRAKWADRAFALQFFVPPPPETAVELADTTTGQTLTRFSFGEIVLYEDHNGDGRLAVEDRDAGSAIAGGDQYRGGGLPQVVVYVWTPKADAGAISSLDSVLGGDPGYRLGFVSCTGGLFNFKLQIWNAAATFTVDLTEPQLLMPFQRTCLPSLLDQLPPGMGP